MLKNRVKSQNPVTVNAEIAELTEGIDEKQI